MFPTANRCGYFLKAEIVRNMVRPILRPSTKVSIREIRESIFVRGFPVLTIKADFIFFDTASCLAAISTCNIALLSSRDFSVIFSIFGCQFFRTLYINRANGLRIRVLLSRYTATQTNMYATAPIISASGFPVYGSRAYAPAIVSSNTTPIADIIPVRISITAAAKRVAFVAASIVSSSLRRRRYSLISVK